MSKKVYFTAHADNPAFVSAAHRLLTLHWETIRESTTSKDPRYLCAAFVQALGAPLFLRAAEISKEIQIEPTLKLRTLAMELMAHASFAEALSRWSTTSTLDVEFREEHLETLDHQVASLQLTQDREFFFALMHVCLGDLCSDSDRESVLGGGRLIAICLPEGQTTFSMLDILMPIHNRVQIAANAEPDLIARLHVSAETLIKGAESVLKLESMIR